MKEVSPTFMIRQAVGAIVYCNNQFLLVHKSQINTKSGIEKISGEWDFIKGGVEANDESPQHAILRELKEETGSADFLIKKQFDERICFEFPEKIKRKIGLESQETTMFLVEYIGSTKNLHPLDEEITKLQFINAEEVINRLTHDETRDFFSRKLSQLSTK